MSNSQLQSKSKLALVLSGGGALGAAHAGVYSALEDCIQPEYIIGTSAGAIIGAAIACGLSSKEISEHINQKNLIKLAFDISFTGGGIIRGNKVLELLGAIYDDREFSDLPDTTSLRICACDFNTAELVVIEKGSIAEAVRASLSIPGIFPPFWIENRPLVDGGLIANLPLQHAQNEYKGDRILAVDVLTCIPSFHRISRETPLSLRKSIERGLRVFFAHQRKQIAADQRVVFIEPELQEYHSADILRLSKIENVGYQAGLSMRETFTAT